jgi:Tfp pilus assembly protein PilE
MSVNSNKNRRAFGFTTIELLIVIVVIIILGSLIVVTYHGVQQRNHDTERKTDIIKMDGQIEAYQAETDKYPSVAQMNNGNFRTTNLKGLTQENLTDPLWKNSNSTCTANGSAILQGTATPVLGCYGYDPSPAGCDNENTDCTGYILTTQLETGGVYTKESIN